MDKRFHCQHCGEKVSKTLYYQHKRLYYSSASNTWRSNQDTHDADGAAQSETPRLASREEFSFSDSEQENG